MSAVLGAGNVSGGRHGEPVVSPVLGEWCVPHPAQYQQFDKLRLMHGLETIYAGLELRQRCLGICIDIIFAQRAFIELFWGPHQQRLQEVHEKLIVVLPRGQSCV